MSTKQLLFACALLFALQACKNKGQNPEVGATTATIPTPNTTLPAAPLAFKKQEFKSKQKEQSADYRVDVAQGDSPQAKFINKTIFRALNGSQENADKGNFNYQQMADDFVATAVEYQAEDPSGDWSSDNNATVHYNSANFVCILLGGWEYAGGAHGNPWSNVLYIDVPNQKTLTQKDIFSDEMGLRKMISPLLDKELKKTSEYDDSYLENFADNGVVRMPSCVYLTQTEVVFDFSHQELYDAGSNNAISTEVKLPLSQVHTFLKVKL